MPERRSIHCPECGTPFDVTITDDGRVRTRGCTYADRPGHLPVSEADIIEWLNPVADPPKASRSQPPDWRRPWAGES